jgi:hypothetical protein
MKARLVIAAAILGGCSGSPYREGTVATRLMLLDAAPSVGKPLRVRLELVNLRAGTVLYDAQQADCNASLEVVGPDGKPAPYLAGFVSTSGQYEELAALTGRAIVDELDVASQYLISKPGRYTIRFTGRGLGVIDASSVPSYRPGEPNTEEVAKAWTDPWVVPSNLLTIDVRPGPVPDSYVLVERLLAGLPEGWLLIWEPPSKSPEPQLTLIRYGERKQDVMLISLRVSSQPPEGEEKKEGEWEGRNVYVASGARAERMWPGHRARLVQILNSR